MTSLTLDFIGSTQIKTVHDWSIYFIFICLHSQCTFWLLLTNHVTFFLYFIFKRIKLWKHGSLDGIVHCKVIRVCRPHSFSALALPNCICRIQTVISLLWGKCIMQNHIDKINWATHVPSGIFVLLVLFSQLGKEVYFLKIAFDIFLLGF